MSEALYLYGFLAPPAADPPAGLLGVAGRRVHLVHVDDALLAAVSRVPAEAYAPERLEARMHDLEWIGEQGALHERVVTWFVDQGGILPARLLTLYSTEEALRGAVSAQSRVLAEQLRRLHGLREWDVKVSYDARVLAEELGDLSGAVARLDGEIAAAAPGRRYLLERKRAQLVADETGRVARELASAVHEALLSASVEARRLPLPRERTDLPVVLNAAYLVAREHEDEFRRVAEARSVEAAPRGIRVQPTGPWAPYRFLGEPEAEVDAAVGSP